MCVGAQQETPKHHVRVEGRIGFGASGTAVRDGIATPILSGGLGNIEVRPVSAKFKPAPELGIGIVMPLRAGTSAIVSGSWSPSTLRADDGGAARDVQDVAVVQAMLSVRHAFGSLLEAGGGIGGTHMVADDEALLRGASAFSPVVEALVGAGWDVGLHRVHIGAVAQLERFSSQSLSELGGDPGNVMRYALRASWTWKGASR